MREGTWAPSGAKDAGRVAIRLFATRGWDFEPAAFRLERAPASSADVSHALESVPPYWKTSARWPTFWLPAPPDAAPHAARGRLAFSFPGARGGAPGPLC